MGEVMDEDRAVAMLARHKKTLRRVEEEKLPGFIDYFKSSSEARTWILDKLGDAERALDEGDEFLFEKGLNSYVKGCGKINQVLAERYRKNNTNPEEWELRYVRFMRIKYIKFGSELWDFYLVPMPPRGKPKASHWYTVAEMMDILDNETAASAMKVFKILPVRPESTEKPYVGDKVLVVDVTPEGVDSWYERTGHIGRKRVC